jgi:type II secretory pathway component GspD/PulD (secretin)
VGNVASGPGGIKVGIVSNDVSVFIRALDEVTDTTVLSNPKIMTLNRQSGRVLVGRKVGYLNTTATDTSTTQSVEFLDTGTSLYFRPFVTTNGLIRMEVKPKVAEAAIRQISDIGGNPVTIPDEITNEITTNILVRDGQTVVLGGLFRENVTVTRKQVPVLGDIPFIGNAFRGHDDSTNRNEIIFLITPTIVDDAMVTESGERGSQYVDRIVAGIPASRRRRSRNPSLLVAAPNARDG